jgi:hypothetical protein
LNHAYLHALKFQKMLGIKIWPPPAKGLLRKIYFTLLSTVIVFFALSSYQFISSCWFLYTADRVPGTVVDNIWHSSSNRKTGARSTSYTPVFEYRYKDETLRHESIFGSGTFTYEMDEQVEMLIDPDTGFGKSNSFLELWFLPFILAAAGCFFLIFLVFAAKLSRSFF